MKKCRVSVDPSWRKYTPNKLKNFAFGAENGLNRRLYSFKAFQDSKIITYNA